MPDMASGNLYAPWRMDYIRSLPAAEGCFICDAAAADDPQTQQQRLVLWRSRWSVVLMNRYPYTNGHLLVAPAAHKGELEELSRDELCDLAAQTVRAVQLLRRCVSAQGFNIGVNLGRCAGAGLPGHVHQHVVPRWAGDTNFMHVVGETQIIPQAVSQLWNELRRTLAAMESEKPAAAP